MPSRPPKPPPQAKRARVSARPAKAQRAARAVELSLAGADGATIGEALGISKSQANRVLQTKDSEQIIVELVNNRSSRLSDLFDRGLQVIEEAFDAETEVHMGEHGSWGGGPDHYARLAAHGHLVKTLIAGRPKPKPPERADERRTMTLEEIEAQLQDPQEPIAHTPTLYSTPHSSQNPRP